MTSNPPENRVPDCASNDPQNRPQNGPTGINTQRNPLTIAIGLIQAMSRTRTRRTIRNILGAGFLTLMAYGITRDDADEIEFPYDGTEFTLEDMSLEDKVSQLYHGSAYDSRMGDVADRALNHRKLTSSPRLIEFTDWLTDWLKSDQTIGGVHVFRSDARSLDEANRTAIEIMAKSKIPPFITMDIVGGFTRHLGLTREEARYYGVPEEFLEMAKERANLELPTQEDLGKRFDQLVRKRDYEGQIKFRKEMEKYGAAIARMCRDIGIVVNFAPVMDLVEDIDGNQFMEKNDETYGSNIHTVMVLAFHYIKGFQSVDNGTMIAPKHFAGTGKMGSNPHEEEDPGISTMSGKDGTMLPFLDAINGELFHDPICKAYALDFRVRRLMNDIAYLETVIMEIESKGKNAMKSKNYRQATRKLREAREDLQAIYEEYRIDESFVTTDPIRGLMVGHAQNFMNPDTPGSLSPEIVKTRLRERLKFKGIAWTDDMSMGVIDFYVTNGDGKKHDKGPGERYAQALATEITIPMLLHQTGNLDEMVDRIRRAIKDREDFDRDGNPDITMEGIDRRVRQVLEQKAQLGLLTKRTETREVNCAPAFEKAGPEKKCLRPVTVYKNNAREYMSTTRAHRNATRRGK